MMWIQIRTTGGGGGVQGHAPLKSFIKMVQSGAFWVFQNYVIINLNIKLNINKFKDILHNSKNDSPWSVSNTNLD